MAEIFQDGAAITYLQDVKITITGAGADDGNKYLTGDTMPSGTTARVLATNSVYFKVNEAEVTFDRRLEDHSQGQSFHEHNRIKKLAQSVRFRRNLEINDAVGAVLATNDVVVFSITGKVAGSNTTVTDGSIVPEPFQITNALAIIGNANATFNAPTTMEISLESYGRAWT